MKGKAWTDVEIEFLKQNAGKLPCAEIAKKLGRPLGSIHSIRTRLGIREKFCRPSKIWTKDNIKYLKNNYNKLTLKKIAAALRCSETAVSEKAKELGLSATNNKTSTKGYSPAAGRRLWNR